MDERIKELIAIGASVSGHCQPCLDHHLEKAAELGVDDEDIRQAIEIGHQVEKGALIAMKQYVTTIMDQQSHPGESSCCPGSHNKCCG